MTQTYFQVIAHYYVKPEETETVAELLGQLAEASRQEKANLSYEFFRSVHDSAHFVILERYTDAGGFAKHREYEHFKSIGVQRIIPRLVRREIETYEGRADA
ncbi:putative quinol monooxygenase [Paenarthrobacter sp. NPDC092416]|uniref:putative quinol monooxygenase n=1 Tax=Paenarthrobacter sp. NPDC092416 TaxID=3364386 RepID=UPI0037FC6242